MLALRSKYAVTLYEILEAYVNRREKRLTVSIEDFRSWLKVPEDAYRDWKDLKRNVVLPAVNEINQHGEEGGFFVNYEGVREGKSFTKIKFMLVKSAERDDRDMKLQGKARRGRALRRSRPAGGATRRSVSADRRGSGPVAHDCARMGPARSDRSISRVEQGQGCARTIRTARSSAGRSGSLRKRAAE